MSVDDGLRKIFRQNIKGCHWQTIERLLDRGVPDSNLCVDGTDLWIEYKATRIWHVKIRPEQVGWLLTRERHGGVTVIATRRRNVRASPRTDQLWLVRGWQARLFQERGLLPWSGDGGFWERGLIGVWDGGPSEWNWDAIRDLLTKQRRRRAT